MNKPIHFLTPNNNNGALFCLFLPSLSPFRRLCRQPFSQRFPIRPNDRFFFNGQLLLAVIHCSPSRRELSLAVAERYLRKELCVSPERE
jgi:hypothetical protein